MDNTLQFRETSGINAYQLKLIAIIGMTFNHIGLVFGNYILQDYGTGNYLPVFIETALYAFGGLTIPIMAFMISEGYKYTSNFKRYVGRLLCFAAAAYIPFAWVFHAPLFNVLFTFAMGLITLYLHDHMKNRVGFWFVFAGLTAATVVMDGALAGVPMILLYHVLEGKRGRLVIPALILACIKIIMFIFRFAVPDWTVETILLGLPDLSFAFVGCMLTIPLLSKYNGKQYGNTKPPKYLFYIYYPAHILILCLVRGFMFGEWFLF